MPKRPLNRRDFLRSTLAGAAGLCTAGGLGYSLFDPRALGAAEDEVPEGYNCDLCGSCFDGLACLGSRCQPCELDRNCCSQQVCEAGRCVNLVR